MKVSKRTFFRQCGAFVAGVAFALDCIGKQPEQVEKPKDAGAKRQIAVPNPAYVNAPYEICVFREYTKEDKLGVYVHKRTDPYSVDPERIIKDTFRLRFDKDMKSVPYMLIKEV